MGVAVIHIPMPDGTLPGDEADTVADLLGWTADRITQTGLAHGAPETFRGTAGQKVTVSVLNI